MSFALTIFNGSQPIASTNALTLQRCHSIAATFGDATHYEVYSDNSGFTTTYAARSLGDNIENMRKTMQMLANVIEKSGNAIRGTGDSLDAADDSIAALAYLKHKYGIVPRT